MTQMIYFFNRVVTYAPLFLLIIIPLSLLYFANYTPDLNTFVLGLITSLLAVWWSVSVIEGFTQMEHEKNRAEVSARVYFRMHNDIIEFLFSTSDLFEIYLPKKKPNFELKKKYKNALEVFEELKKHHIELSRRLLELLMTELPRNQKLTKKKLRKLGLMFHSLEKKFLGYERLYGAYIDDQVKDLILALGHADVISRFGILNAINESIINSDAYQKVAEKNVDALLLMSNVKKRIK
ncbi:Uncharacterised protein [uncultured archaeon]|nr:Uncharacterised protein [uncultured archaeon]